VPTPAPVQSPAPPADPVQSPAPTPVSSPTPTKPGFAAGRIFLDRNNDGVFDKGDRSLAGWYVYADLDGTGIHRRGEPLAQTNANGMFRMRLPVGSYTIREITGPRFVVTTPVSSGLDVTIDSGEKITDQDFANELKSVVSSRIPVA
jgi:hypothetical protein